MRKRYEKQKRRIKALKKHQTRFSERLNDLNQRITENEAAAAAARDGGNNNDKYTMCVTGDAIN